MSFASPDLAAILDNALEFATKNLRIERILIQIGLDPTNVTYDAIFNRLLDLALANITFASVLALIGGIFLISTFVVRTIVPMRILCIVSIVFFLGSAALAGSVPKFFLYLLALPINVIRLVQIRNLVKKARSSAQGTLSLGWLRPFMTPRSYQKGDVLFRKGDPATEMFLTVTGKFLVTEINIEIPPERILGELGILSPKNHRTQSVECIEDGEVLTITYDKLLEIYFQNPEFGYYFLRLTSDRLLQNHARLEGLVEEGKAALAAIDAAQAAKLRNSNQAGGASEKKPLKGILATINATRTAGAGANRRQKASAATRSPVSAGHVTDKLPKQKAGPVPVPDAPPSPSAADIEAARRRMRALAIVDRHANYSGASGFIPLPIASVVAITAVIAHMARALNELYGVPVERNRAYGIAIGLIGGLIPTRLATITAAAIVTVVPGPNLVGLAVSSVTASAYTRKIGRMLIDDFERKAAIQRDRLAWQSVRRWQNIWPIRLVRSDRARSRSAWDSARRGWLRR